MFIFMNFLMLSTGLLYVRADGLWVETLPFDTHVVLRIAYAVCISVRSIRVIKRHGFMLLPSLKVRDDTASFSSDI